MFENSLLKLFNRLVASQAWACHRLAEHAGQVVALRLAQVCWTFRIEDDSRLSAVGLEENPSVTLTISSSGVFALIAGQADEVSKHVEISGNAKLAETVSALLQHLRPDLGAMLSPILGDALAHRSELMVSHLGQLTRELLYRSRKSVEEHLVSEDTLSPLTSKDFRSHQADVQALTDRLACLEARIPNR